jgi:hypothetical protein
MGAVEVLQLPKQVRALDLLQHAGDWQGAEQIDAPDREPSGGMASSLATDPGADGLLSLVVAEEPGKPAMLNHERFELGVILLPPVFKAGHAGPSPWSTGCLPRR